MKKVAWVSVISRFIVLGVFYMLLSIPDSVSIFKKPANVSSGSVEINPAWAVVDDQMIYCSSLHKEQQDSLALSTLNSLNDLFDLINSDIINPDHALIDSISQGLMFGAARVSVMRKYIPEFLNMCINWNQMIKDQALFWDLTKAQNNDKLFSILNSSRIAMMAAETQLDGDNLIMSTTQPRSFAPSIEVNGLTIHSGDILISNHVGYFPYYSLGKRGKGFWSTAAIASIEDESKATAIFVDPANGLSEIPIKTFLLSKNSPTIILRVRSDLKELISNPILPVEAAQIAHSMLSNDIVFDFDINPETNSALYDAEFITLIFNKAGLDLSISFSSIDDLEFILPLTALGIKNMNAAMPFEYLANPKLLEAGEFFSSEGGLAISAKYASTRTALLSVDTKFIQSMRWKLPMYRALKAYSMLKNIFGFQGPIPREMSAQTALTFSAIHVREQTIMDKIELKLDKFMNQNDYVPTYGIIVDFAKDY